MVELISNHGEEEVVKEEVVNTGPEWKDHLQMKDKPGFEEIGHGILVKKNYLDLTDLNFIKYQAEELPEEDWHTHPTGSYLQGKISTNLAIYQLNATFIDEAMPEYWTNEHKSVNRIRPGDELKKFGSGTWQAADYIAIYYFGEWEGGDLILLEKDGQEVNFEFKPEENNIYLLPILDHELYISKPVTSGIKYSHIDWVYRHSDWFLA